MVQVYFSSGAVWSDLNAIWGFMHVKMWVEAIYIVYVSVSVQLEKQNQCEIEIYRKELDHTDQCWSGSLKL